MRAASDRERMLRDIAAEVAATRSHIGREAFAPAVLAAMREVPREEFVPADLQRAAFDNGPLPIGHGQTISQPYIVALMTDLLAPQPEHLVLEVGTGSGYQAAVLARLVRQVHSVEIVAALGQAAAERLQRLGYANVSVRIGDGYAGWPELAPFDGIVVTAAAPHVPPPLVEQLKPGGRMVIPVGRPYWTQRLTLVEKDAGGQVSSHEVLPVAFVPLTGPSGWE